METPEAKRARLTAAAAKQRRQALSDAAKAARTLSQASREARRALEDIYLSPRDRARVLLGLTGLGAAAASLATGAPIYLAAPRIANNLYTILRAGKRVRATRDTYLGLAQLLEEILA